MLETKKQTIDQSVWNVNFLIQNSHLLKNCENLYCCMHSTLFFPLHSTLTKHFACCTFKVK